MRIQYDNIISKWNGQIIFYCTTIIYATQILNMYLYTQLKLGITNIKCTRFIYSPPHLENKNSFKSINAGKLDNFFLALSLALRISANSSSYKFTVVNGG